LNRFIVIEGVIGAGKTSLAIKLKEELGGRNVFEEFEENPFLSDFYKERKRFAFQTQMFFLLSRFKQQEKILQTDLFADNIISDYFFEKDRIFATLNLDDREMVLYDSLASILEKQIVRPNLVIYLNSSVDRLMHNITQRDRPMERGMDRQYISDLADSYNKFFSQYYKAPLIVIDSSSMEFINSDKDFDLILSAINNHHSGKLFISQKGAFNAY
jgi:deoxyguanosine kinase